MLILDKSLYVKKANTHSDCNKFKHLNEDLTSKLEGQVQRALRGMNKNLPEKEYFRLYPRGSKPAHFYGTAKIHKVKENEGPEML